MKGYDPSTGLGCKQNGDYVDVTLPYARNPGEGVLIGALFGACINGGASGAPDVLYTEGVHGLAAATGTGTDAIFGAKAYWDNTNKRITPVASGNSYVGAFMADKTTTQAAALVRLNEFVV